MKHLSIKLSLTMLLFALCSGAWAQQILQPTDNCRDHAASDIATFVDAVLEQEVREALSFGPQDALSCGQVAQLTTLRASGGGCKENGFWVA